MYKSQQINKFSSYDDYSTKISQVIAVHLFAIQCNVYITRCQSVFISAEVSFGHFGTSAETLRH